VNGHKKDYIWLILGTRYMTESSHGETFTQAMPKWKQDVWECWKSYAEAQYCEY
jgi:hypothetical protein